MFTYVHKIVNTIFPDIDNDKSACGISCVRCRATEFLCTVFFIYFSPFFFFNHLTLNHDSKFILYDTYFIVTRITTVVLCSVTMRCSKITLV